MQIEAGKYYRTRGGERAFVSAAFGENPFTTTQPVTRFAGYIEGSTVIYGWGADGVSRGPIGAGDDDRDLIAEWQEPAVVERLYYLVRDADGNIDTWRGKPAEGGCWTLIGSGRLVLKEGEFAE